MGGDEVSGYLGEKSEAFISSEEPCEPKQAGCPQLAAKAPPGHLLTCIIRKK